MRLPRALGAAALLGAILARPVPARAEVLVKLATLAPSGSAWHDLLRELGQAWQRASDGQVRVKVYAGGSQGSEGEMIRKLAIGQLQAAALTNVGLHDLVPEPQALSVPLLFAGEAELACTFERVRPRLEAALAAKGYVVVQWSRVGAVFFFCNAPFATPAEMARAKLFAWEGDPGTVEAWRAAGFRPVVLSSTDVVPALQTGMVDCVGNVPLYVLTAHLYEKARFELDLPWGWVMGATLVRADAWAQVPQALKPRLLEIAHELGARVDAEVERLNADALSAMRQRGLTVVKVDPAAWRPVLEKSWSALRGPVVPAPFFDEVVAARDACRASLAKGP
jgi:TRAP-type transport system periplasmic protein